MSTRRGPGWAEFLKLFRETARYRNRYEVFRDFVTIAAITLHNSAHMVDALEQEYLTIIGRYERDDIERFPRLLGMLIAVLDSEPWDALGQLFMELNLGSEHVGQFFTPPELSELMARLAHGDSLKDLGGKPFITVSEPACGAGGMILAFTKVLIEAGHNPAEKMWVECRDIDRTAALMCYVQLALWNIPGVVIVGNTIKMEAREVFYTPAHYLYRWDDRFAVRRAIEAMQKLISTPVIEASAVLPDDGTNTVLPSAEPVDAHPEPNVKPMPGSSGVPAQFDFGF